MIFQHELISCLKKYAGETAILDGDVATSYEQLLADANRVTRFLINKGIRKGTMVGISLDNRTKLITTIIGILNAGCVFVPIDSNLPQYRLDSMTDKLKLQYYIYGSVNEKVLVQHGITIEDIFSAEANTELVEYPVFDASDNIYVYFTSGSTGTPKGILGRNESLAQFISWEISAFDIQRGCRVSQFISPYFDAFLRDIFVPLMAGGTICVPPAGDTFRDAGFITQWINAQKINLIHCVPSLFRLINNEQVTAADYENLQHVLLSGEKINPADLKPWYQTFDTRISLVNLYGPSETTMIRTFYRIQPTDANQPRIPVGQPIPGTRILIAKKDLTPCEKLIPGELYIISAYSSNGYLDEPALSQERFITIHAGTKDEAQAYRTGDIARMLINGNIDLIGREDRQVKLRGARIELDEIERVLLDAGYLEQAVVMKHQDEHNNEYLVAFLVRKPGAVMEGDIRQLSKTFLADRLPAYMIPGDFREVAHVPLLSNGKINYKELLHQMSQRQVIAPENDIEARLLSVWKDTLGDKEFSTDDSFYKVGGNSLNTMKLIGRIHKEFNVRISLSELFNHLTIQQQARMVGKRHADNQMTIEKAADKAAYHVSAVQERIYYTYELNKTGVAFNLPVAWKVDAALDLERLTAALKALIQRHESLRTGFGIADGQLLQTIASDVEFTLETIETDIASIPEVIDSFIRPFDLAKPGLLRCAVVRLKDAYTMMIVDIHHIICDGISQVILFNDLIKLYNGSQLASLPIQYRDYAEWEYQFRKSELYMSQREFWLNQFEGELPVTNFPVTVVNAGPDPDAGDNIFFRIGKEQRASFMRVLQEEEMTVSSGLFAAYFIFIGLLTGQEDAILGLGTSGRIQHELEEVTGMFVKTLPVRFQLDTDLTFRKFAKAIHHHLVEVISRQQFDLSDILGELNASRNKRVNELFKAVFVYQDFEDRATAEHALFEPYQLNNAAAKYPVTLFASGNGEGYDFRFEYQLSYFSVRDAELLVDRFINLFSSIAANPDITLVSLAGYNAVPDSPVTDNIILNL
ncbi:non-ribosomal peptide synthetase [Chitinophaga rhizophila]|uniref:Amino acid adenylation domain-containing protein n=1 Tax=Chitinophaga rhizophila TaxID=2866212 RepID=A0ABS7GHP0_9BACT|nr:non-ribosomal peptide synthetase [Chitinophaga rhizophila]MBW8687220.1 amino acid adenylation domain-containing protein [Chitinophaga rhizophila]